MGSLKLWAWIDAGRGVHGHAGAAAQKLDSHKLTNRQQEQRLREHFVSPRRVREWRDIHSQLHTVVAEHGWRLNTAAGHLRAAAPVDAGRAAGQHRLQVEDDDGTWARAASASGATRART
jgi:ATP-dependent helicase HrpA